MSLFGRGLELQMVTQNIFCQKRAKKTSEGVGLDQLLLLLCVRPDTCLFKTQKIFGTTSFELLQLHYYGEALTLEVS